MPVAAKTLSGCPVLPDISMKLSTAINSTRASNCILGALSLVWEGSHKCISDNTALREEEQFWQDPYKLSLQVPSTQVIWHTGWHRDSSGAKQTLTATKCVVLTKAQIFSFKERCTDVKTVIREVFSSLQKHLQLNPCLEGPAELLPALHLRLCSENHKETELSLWWRISALRYSHCLTKDGCHWTAFLGSSSAQLQVNGAYNTWVLPVPRDTQTGKH